jgi:hypothetical protein
VNSNDLQTVYDELDAMLREMQLVWVVEQVEQQLAEGRLVTKENVPTYKKSDEQSSFQLSDQDFVPSRKAKFIALEEYTPIERAKLIVDAVQVVVDTAMMERELVTYFSNEMGEQPSPVVQIVSDDEDAASIVLSPKIPEDQIRVFDQLVSILNRLRREIDNASG